MATRWRWVYHEVFGLKLFLDVHYDKNETCTKQPEKFIFEIPIPENILKIMPKTIPEIPNAKRG